MRFTSHAEVSKRSTRGNAIEMIHVEPLARIDPEEKDEAFPLKRKMNFNIPWEGQLMSDAIKIPRISRRLEGMRPPTPGGSSSVGKRQEVQEVHEIAKEKGSERVYESCWNIGKSSRMISVDEKREWVGNILPSGARTKFEVDKSEELVSHIDHALYEVCGFS